MKERLTQLLQQFQQANAATRITLVLSTLVVFSLVAFSSWYASRPDFVEHFSGLTAAQASSYKAALAEAGIPFKSSPPPGPYSIWVDSGDEIRAEAQVARGGYTPESKGIQVAAGGAQSAFLSAGERDLMMNKREWQECEKLLETLEFVDRATVVGSKSQHSPFRRDIPATISVTLGLRYGTSLGEVEARNVATLVRGRFNVPIENITILDEDGTLLHDGSLAGSDRSKNDLFAQKSRFEAEAERKANRQLELALGAGMASVTVSSDWTFDETESIKNVPVKGAETYKRITEDSSSGADAGGVGGPAGLSSNLTQDFGVENAGVSEGSSASTRKQSTDESRTVVGHETEHKVSRAPQIKRMSVSLVFDESIPAESTEALDKMVKAAVGFMPDRDEYQSLRIALASVSRDEEGNPLPIEPPAPIEQPNQYVELFMTHGVELLAGLAFVIVLIKALRGAGGGAGSRKQSAQAVAEAEAAVAQAERELSQVDPALLARLQVEELVRSEPERVSEILAQWAADELASAGAGR